MTERPSVVPGYNVTEAMTLEQYKAARAAAGDVHYVKPRAA